jgi:hypothetical protein
MQAGARHRSQHGTPRCDRRGHRHRGRTGIGFFAHAISENNEGLKALILAAPAFTGPGFLVPTRNHDLFGWCLEHRLRLVKQATLMTMGLYNEPAGAYLPSILY